MLPERSPEVNDNVNEVCRMDRQYVRAYVTSRVEDGRDKIQEVRERMES